MTARRGNRTPGDLARARARMDRLNLRLRDLLQQRARLASEIARWKAARGLPVADPAREQSMLANMLDTPGPGFDRAVLGRLLRAVLAASRAAALEAAAPHGAVTKAATTAKSAARARASRARRRRRA